VVTNPADLAAWIPRLAGQRICVVGDVILDEYVTGRAARLSREAPIPVLEFESRDYIAGGAGNPAANIATLGSHAGLIGVIGADAEGTTLRSVLLARGIDVSGLVIDADRPTTLKTRLLAQMGLRFPQQVARIDRLSRQPIRRPIETALLHQITTALPTADAVLFSDYHGGLITKRLITAAQSSGRLTTADAQGELTKYTGCAIIKCNADDAAAYLGRPLHTDADFAAAASTLSAALRVTRGLVITRGADGATLAEPPPADQPNALPHIQHIPAPAITDVYDTVGAGDTAIAVMTLAVSVDAPLTMAVLLANYASGIVVRRVGNYAPTPHELAAAL